MMTETIGALTMSVPSDREIVLTRAFEAPRDLVFETFTRPEHPGLVTDVFTEEAGWTTLVETMLFPSKEARDGLLSSDMKRGSAETFDRLAELLASLRVKQ